MNKHRNFLSKVFTGLTIVLLVLGGNINVAEAATFTFTQTDWTSLTSNTAVHPTNQNNWAQYTSTTTGLTTANSGADLQLGPPTSASVTKTTDADFNNGIFNQTAISSNSVKLATTTYQTNYQTKIATIPSLVSYWKMDNDWADSEGTNHGFIPSGWQAGKLNNALGFDGVDDYVGKSSGVSGIGGTNQMTYEVWVKRNAINVQQMIYVLGSTSGYNYQALFIQADNTVRADFGAPSGNYMRVLVTTNTLTDTTSWHHIVATYNAGTIHIYVDNEEWTGTYYGTWTGNVVAPTAPLYIGNTINGLLDEVRIYNNALSQSDITTLYNSGNGTETPASGAVAGWHLNETSGDSAADYIGSNTGTLKFFPGMTFGSAKYGSAAGSFDGVDDYMRSSSYSLPTYPKTIEFWFKTNDTSPSDGAGRGLLRDGSLAGGAGHTIYQKPGTNYLQVAYGDSATWKFDDVEIGYDLDEWNHFALVLTGALSGTAYMNGQSWFLSFGASQGSDNAYGGLDIGRGDGYREFNGLIDEVAVYNTALSASTISNHYLAYYSSGTYEPASINLGQKSNFSTLSFNKTTNASTTLTIDIRAGNTATPPAWGSSNTDWPANASSTNVSSGGDISGLNGYQYIQYRANLFTTDTDYTPSLDDITINYSYYSVSSSLTSSSYDTSSSANLIGGISWAEDVSLPSGTGVTVSLRTASTSDNLGSATWTDFTNSATGCSKTSGVVTCSATAIPSLMKDGINDQWFQYKVSLSSEGFNTPTVSNVNVTYVVNAPPQFNSGFGANGVSVSQITDSTDLNWNKVQIQYSARDTDTTSGTNRPGNDVTPSFEYTLNGSDWYPITADYLAAGDLDNKTVEESNYTTYTAYWDAQSQISGNYTAGAQIRVSIDDGELANNTATALGANFILDTTKPTLTGATLLINDSSDTVATQSSIVTLKLQNVTGNPAGEKIYTQFSRDGSTWYGANLNNTLAEVGSWGDGFNSDVTTLSNLSWSWTLANRSETITVRIADTYGNIAESTDTNSAGWNATPEFESIPIVSQIANSADPNWGKVTIQYSVRDTDTDQGLAANQYKVTPSFEYNIGSGWEGNDITADYLNTGALNVKTVAIDAYNTYTAVWDAKTQIPETYSASAQVRVTVDDNEAVLNTASSTGASFPLDTKNVTVTTFTLDSSVDAISLNLSDDNNIEYRLSNSSDFSGAEWQAVGGTSTTTTLSWEFTGSPSFETVYLGVRDALGNMATSSATAPSAPQNLSIFDISNAATSDYKEFLNWRLYTSTTTALFQKYEIDRSTDGINYSLLTTITNSSQNYYTDSTVASTTTYYYKMRILDTNNDISSYSAMVSDLPDGQGGSDYIPPTLTNLAVAEIQATWARITWTTDELSNSRVEFSTELAGDYTSSTTVISYVTSHEVTIPDLAPNTSYVFRVKSKDVLNNEGSSDGAAFTTLGGPIISDATTESVNDRGAVIFWNTNEDSNSYVVYSTNLADLRNNVNTSEIGTPSMVGGPPFQHRVTLSSLNPRTTYYYYVKSTDIDTNTVTDKNDGNYYSFVTTYDTKAPVISNISTPVKTSSVIVILWQTDELANSQVEYGRTSAIYTDTTTLDSTFSISHAVSLSSLNESTTYYYRAKSADANGNQATSLEQLATTTSAREIVIQQVGGGGGIAVERDTSAPVISNINVSNISAFGATVSFNTNELTTGFVLYGKDTKYGNTAGSSEFKTSHSINLSGLKLGSNYHFKVIAVDKSGNTSISEDKTFATKFAAEALEELVTLENAEQFQEELEGMIESVMPSLVPPVISQVEVSDITENSATVNWRSNVPAYGTLAYAGEKDYQSYVAELSQVEKKTREHKIELTGLSPATLYHIQARSFVFPGVIGKSKDITFTTKASKVKPEISKLGNTEAEIRWVTEKETSSFAEYTNLITKKIYRVGDAAMVRTHALKLENLVSDTPYEIRSFGYDANNVLVEGDPLRIRTKKDIVPPGISALRIDNALLPGRTDKLQSVISWKTDESANSLVYFEEGVGIAEELANKAGFENEYTADHIVILTNLKPATIYRIRVASSDESDNLTESPIRTILTPRSPESVFDIIIRNFQDTFGFLKKLQ